MAGRPKIFNEQHALNEATNLFWKKGYESTSLDDLMNVMKIQKGSFYNAFGSKKQLHQKAINHHENSTFAVFEKIIKESNNPIELIKSIFISVANCKPDEHTKGCFLGNTLAELTNSDVELTKNAKKHLKHMELLFFEQISLAQKKGILKTKAKAKVLARYLLNLWNGINITRRMYPTKKDLLPLIEFQLAIIN
jgi:TetR/AcrR family transcriptional regulator, transcriptional repressor for nem operon